MLEQSVQRMVVCSISNGRKATRGPKIVQEVKEGDEKMLTIMCWGLMAFSIHLTSLAQLDVTSLLWHWGLQVGLICLQYLQAPTVSAQVDL